MSARVSAVLLTAALTLPGVAVAGPEADAYLQGYVSAVLAPTQRSTVVLGVQDGAVLLDEDSVRPDERPLVEQQVRTVQGVRGVEWVRRDDVRVLETATLTGSELSAIERDGWELLPEESVFEDLTADPRWPRFSVSYQGYRDDVELGKVGAVSLGGTLPVVQGTLPGEGRWDLGIQGSVYSIFDLEVSSLDLVNSDFFVALPVSARWGPVSMMVRPLHQSSHLGDEFLLRDRTERIDVSFEAVDALLSIDLGTFGRLYGGAGILVHRKPDDIKRRSVQAGIELTSPWAFFSGRVRPFAALDVQRAEENEYRSDYSARVGFQLENPRLLRGRRLQLFGEYYKGFSPNGQFFTRQIEYFGGGFQFFF
jgi:hypothetical protein